MKAAECSKIAKAMKAAKCSNEMKAAECSQAAACSKDAKKMTPTKKWRSLPGHANFCDAELVEEDFYAIKDPKGQVEWEVIPPQAFGATITDALDWDVIPLRAFFKNGRVKFKYIWLKKEQ